MEASAQRIVVGVDDSDGSRLALAWALEEAARRRATVEAVTAYPIDFSSIAPYLPDHRRLNALRDDTDARARALVDEVRATGGPGAGAVDVSVLVCAGAPAVRLVSAAAGADLLVVGSRGHGALRSAVVGSVALHCAAHAPCRVVVVHPGGAPATEPPRVVVGLDDSDHGRLALAAAVAEAETLAARVEAVLAYQAPYFWGDLYVAPMPSIEEVQQATLERGRAIVEQVLGAGGGAVEVCAVEGHPVEVLTSRAEGARLLVLGSRSRSQLEGVVLGSVALRAVMHAPCPVLVVRPPRPGPRPSADRVAAAVSY